MIQEVEDKSSVYRNEYPWAFGIAVGKHFSKNLNFFFFFFCFEVICFWCFQIILMCWSQKWFLKNKKILLAYFSEWKALWKATTTTLSNTLHRQIIKGAVDGRRDHDLGTHFWVRTLHHKCSGWWWYHFLMIDWLGNIICIFNMGEKMMLKSDFCPSDKTKISFLLSWLSNLIPTCMVRLD